MNQFKIAKYVLLVSAGIGLILLIVSGHHLVNVHSTNSHSVIAHQPTENRQETIDHEKERPKLNTESNSEQVSNHATTSVVIKSPQRSTEGNHSVAIWKSHTPEYPFEKTVPGKTTSSQKDHPSPFFVAKNTSVTGVSLLPDDDWLNDSSEINLSDPVDDQSDEWESLPDQLTPQKRPAKVFQSSLPMTETEQQLDSIRQQLGTLANQSELQYQREIRKSAREVQNLHRHIRIDNLQSELQQMKWSLPPREPDSSYLSKQHLGQRYFYIARHRDLPQNKTGQQPKSHPSKTTDEIIKNWSPHQAEELR